MNTITRMLIAATAIAIMGGTALAQEERLLIGSTSTSSSHYGYFVAVSQVINEEVEGVDTTVVETGSSMDNMRRLARDQIDLGLVTTNVTYNAWNGLGAFEGRPQKPLTLWVYAYSPQNVVVREDAGLENLSDLADSNINPGMSGSATEQTTEAVFEALGIAPEWTRGSTGDIVNSIKDSRVVGYVKSGAGDRLDASSIDIATLTPIEILGLNEEQAATIREEFPNLAILDIAEGAAGDGYPAYTTWAFGTAMVADPELDADIVYEIVKAAVEDNEVQAAAFAGVKGSDLPELTMDLATTPLHPGAVRYYEEIGVEVPEHLLPPAE